MDDKDLKEWAKLQFQRNVARAQNNEQLTDDLMRQEVEKYNANSETSADDIRKKNEYYDQEIAEENARRQEQGQQSMSEEYGGDFETPQEFDERVAAEEEAANKAAAERESQIQENLNAQNHSANNQDQEDTPDFNRNRNQNPNRLADNARRDDGRSSNSLPDNHDDNMANRINGSRQGLNSPGLGNRLKTGAKNKLLQKAAKLIPGGKLASLATSKAVNGATKKTSATDPESVGKGKKNTEASGMDHLKGKNKLLGGSDTEEEDENENVSQGVGTRGINLGAVIRFLMKHPYLLFAAGFVLILFIMIIIIIVVMMDEDYAGNYAVVSKCLNETMVIESGPYAGDYSFEYYVAGVVESQIAGIPNVGDETIKALSVVVRNYTIFNTDQCTSTVINDESFQTFVPPSDRVLGITNQPLVGGRVLTDASSTLIDVEYSTFPGQGEDASVPGMPPCSPLECEGEECTTTLYRHPFTSETGFDFTITPKRVDGTDWGVGDLEEQTGHCYGFSILGAVYLEETFHYSDDYILKYFFAGARVTTSTGDVLPPLDPGVFSPLTSAAMVQQNAEGVGRYYFYEGNKYKHTYADDYGVYKFGNCTWYAYGRAKQILHQVHTEGVITDAELADKLNRLNIIGGNGNQWVPGNNGTFPSGSAPRVGALVGFSGTSSNKYGHIAVVEVVYPDGSFDMSEGGRGFSNPQGYGFRHVSGGSINGAAVQGFIYII